MEFFFGQYIPIPKKKIGHDPKGTTLEPLGSHIHSHGLHHLASGAWKGQCHASGFTAMRRFRKQAKPLAEIQPGRAFLEDFLETGGVPSYELQFVFQIVGLYSG